MTANTPWAIFATDGIAWVGLAVNEKRAWTIALGWPSEDEIESAKAKGWYACPVDLVKRLRK